jgi:predicted transcriptional regulator
METAAYYNTNKIEGEALASQKKKNISQEDRVLALFMRYPDKDFATHAIHTYVMPSARITSAQRAITNLTKKGFLEKNTTDKRIMGPYGTLVHTWRLKRHGKNLPEQLPVF